MNRNQILFLLSILMLTGCQLKKPATNAGCGMEGSWALYEVTAQEPASVDFNTEALLKGALETGSLLSFFGDSSFTKAEGNGDFTLGNWRPGKGKDTMVLSPHRGEKKNIFVRIKPPSPEHKPAMLVMARGEFLYTYMKTAVPLQNYRDDPFYKTNNVWRLTPKNEEDSTRVRERLANYFKHLALLLKATKERKETVVSFVYSQGPVMIYNGGIGIVSYNKVKRCWKNGFFDDDAAQYAYWLFENYLSEGHNISAGAGNWIDDDYRILMSIYPAFHAGMKPRAL